MFDSPPRFFLDPWASEYGSALEADLEDEDDAESGEPPEYVEGPSDWSSFIVPDAVPWPGFITFVDGVQQIDSYGRVLNGDRLATAALASIGAGAVICREHGAEYHEEPRIERVLALTESASSSPLIVPVGNQTLHYEPATSSESGAKGVHLAINARRAELERRHAEALASANSLTVLDGRLSFDPGGAKPIVGYIKTIQKFYVSSDRVPKLAELQFGQRTPVFRLKYKDTTRYSWFLRLPHILPIHHAFAGLVRLEAPEVGTAAALMLANLSSFFLPRFASRPEHDQRSPQNLTPIGALERRLRRDLGDGQFIRHSIAAFLHEVGGA